MLPICVSAFHPIRSSAPPNALDFKLDCEFGFDHSRPMLRSLTHQTGSFQLQFFQLFLVLLGGNVASFVFVAKCDRFAVEEMSQRISGSNAVDDLSISGCDTSPFYERIHDDGHDDGRQENSYDGCHCFEPLGFHRYRCCVGDS